MLSAINRTRLLRLQRTFREVYAETGSLKQSTRHTLLLLVRKLLPLARYATFTFGRLFVSHRLRISNERRIQTSPVIGVRILGGAGDYIVIARFLRDLMDFIGPATFDIYSNKRDLADWIFGPLPGFRSSLDEAVFAPRSAGYTAAMQVSQFVEIDQHYADNDALRPHPRLHEAMRAIRDFRPSIEPIIQQHPRLDSFLAQKAIFANRTRRDYLHFMAGLPYASDRLPIRLKTSLVARHKLGSTRYVTVHNGYDPNMLVLGQRATKCYPHFGKVIDLLRCKFPDILFVQVGVHTSVKIPEVDIDLVGATSLPEVAGLISGAVLHLDNEGGLVHLAAALGTKSCVVFGPTASRYFGYPGNINIDPVFCGGCWWINETWMNHCPRSFPVARCMTEQPPSAVAMAVENHLAATVYACRAEETAAPNR